MPTSSTQNKNFDSVTLCTTVTLIDEQTGSAAPDSGIFFHALMRATKKQSRLDGMVIMFCFGNYREQIGRRGASLGPAFGRSSRLKRRGKTNNCRSR